MQCLTYTTSTIRLVLGAIYGIDHKATWLLKNRSAIAAKYSSSGRPHVRHRCIFTGYHTLPVHPSTERNDSYVPFDGCRVSPPRPVRLGALEASKSAVLCESFVTPSTDINAEDDRAKDTPLVSELRIRRRPSLPVAPSLKHTSRRRREPRVLQVSEIPRLSKDWVQRTEEAARSPVGLHSASNDVQDKETGTLINRNQTSKFGREPWQVQKQALSEKFGSAGWVPRKRLSPDALEGIRALHTQHPETYTTPLLAQQFQVSPEAIRRILKSKWRPTEEEESDRLRRWDKRGEEIWSQLVEIGIKPPKKWRDMGVRREEENRTAPKGKTVAKMLEFREISSKHESQVPKYAAASTSVLKSLLSERIL